MVYCIEHVQYNNDAPQHITYSTQKNWAQVKNMCILYCDYLFMYTWLSIVYGKIFMLLLMSCMSQNACISYKLEQIV